MAVKVTAVWYSDRQSSSEGDMTLREQIIIAARRKDADIGDEATITAMEHGWWVAGAIFVRKAEVSQ